MGGVESVGDLISQIEHLVKCETFACDVMFERFTFQQFHDNQGDAVLLIDLVDGANIGMIERGCCARLPTKTFSLLVGLRDSSSGRNLRATKRFNRVSSAL